MSTAEFVFATLQQEGYKPAHGEPGSVTFKYYGQDGHFRVRTLGTMVIGELGCRLPRPVPTAEQTQMFNETHPLARLAGQSGAASITLETLMTERDVPSQVQMLLRLLDQYTADAVFGSAPAEVPAADVDMVVDSAMTAGSAQTQNPLERRVLAT